MYKDANPQQVIFTRRFFVVDDQVSILSSIQEPFDGNISKTHQKVQLSVETKKLSFFQPDQIQVQVIQNYRYNDALRVNTPNFIRGSLLEYNSERDLIFPSGKESRWLDLQSFFHAPLVLVHTSSISAAEMSKERDACEIVILS